MYPVVNAGRVVQSFNDGCIMPHVMTIGCRKCNAMKKVGSRYICRIPGMRMPILPVTTAGLLPGIRKSSVRMPRRCGINSFT